ncbi:unnamed protein product [Echinostoma caproni]|uniref:Uncharacterized protein n=1 Tax=Echinostoma caproni TaxID=27848 RepID=A0A183AHK2_9TREM|nr:unnamed protein product [Echinostoma caproni]
MGPFTVLERKNASFRINRGRQGRWVNGKELERWYTRGNNFKGEASVMEGGIMRVPASERIKNRADPTRCADVAAGSTSRDNVDYHSKRMNRQLQPGGQSASSQKDIHRISQRRSRRATIGSKQSERHVEEEKTYVPSSDQNQQNEA